MTPIPTARQTENNEHDQQDKSRTEGASHEENELDVDHRASQQKSEDGAIGEDTGVSQREKRIDAGADGDDEAETDHGDDRQDDVAADGVDDGARNEDLGGGSDHGAKDQHGGELPEFVARISENVAKSCWMTVGARGSK